jgi:glutaredoxin
MTYIIYTKTGCHNCDRVKALLSKENCERIYINCDELLETGREAFIAEMRKKTGIKEPKSIRFPLIFIDDIFLGDEGDLLNHLVFELEEEF